jgi:hypothetical protein
MTTLTYVRMKIVLGLLQFLRFAQKGGLHFLPRTTNATDSG